MAAEVVSMEREERPPSGGPKPGAYQLSLKTHNILDYVLGVILMLSPAIFGFANIPAARSTFLNLGFTIIGYSLFTRYRWSVFKLIPLGLHMGLDVLLGATLILAPWVIGYRALISDAQLFLHFFLGVGAMLMVGVTRSRTEANIVREDREEMKRAA
jgi:hypothetical protein